MNKQQLATKIWESANKMRSKIEANEYKDYILGFIFYKYLSDKEIKFLKENDFTDEGIKSVVEEDEETMRFIQKGIGYFIAYKDLFSTWLGMGKDFDVSNVRDALSAFSRLINNTHKKVFDGIFDTLQTGLSKLGDSSGSQTKAISDLIQLIKDIPMDGKQDYDILGFIYEYLISMFAANAGKKAGEFYTPHEVSLLMSQIVANQVKEKEEIKIYDPTSGSGSLLINIGRSVAKHINEENNIKYYAQELKQNTYNLTRMNLVMRGILPDNIVARNGDSLDQDWPYFDENDPIRTYNPLYVDAVVSNPPYSQRWDPDNKETDPRYARFGLAPKSKADYAFLLHELYHLRPDGIMTIVLPHGVLFRGGEEGEIRKKLIEANHIDTIIGLPANIFFGTGIPTIIMVLKQKRENTDVLIIDASKGYAKEGKNNKLRASDIKKIVDAFISREKTEKFSRKISRETIRENEYNLNISRYVDSSEDAETWDIYASMFGGIPKSEIDMLKEYWKAFPRLRNALFTNSETPYVGLAVDDVEAAVKGHPDVTLFVDSFMSGFESFSSYLKGELIDKMNEVIVSKEEDAISSDIFKRLERIPLVDKYGAYQLLDDDWTKVAVDLEIIQTEGFEATKKVDPNIVIKKKDGKDQEIQEGWLGHVIPFELVQETLLKEDFDKLKAKEARLAEISSECEELIDLFSEEEKDTKDSEDNAIVNEDDELVSKAVANLLKACCTDIETPIIKALSAYAFIGKKVDKKAYIAAHGEIDWAKMEVNADGTYEKKTVKTYLAELRSVFKFPDDSFESKLMQANTLLAEEKDLKSQIKKETTELHAKTKETIEKLSDVQVLELLELKWIQSLATSLYKLPDTVINCLISRVRVLAEKYATTFSEVEAQIKDTEIALSSLIDELEGSEFDMKGLSALQSLLKGE